MKSMTKSENQFCAEGLLERPRYFPRQLITPAEMTLEQTYFRDKLRRHNRLLHGWGVVCGARVCPLPKPDGSEAEPWKVQIMPGYMLGPYGDEILIDTEREVDLRSTGTTGICGEPPGAHIDPWCADVFVKPQGGPLYVAVKYKEILSRPVRVQPASCGCDDSQCEYSRWCDGYEIGILTECPESHHNPPNLKQEGRPDFEALVHGAITECPSCPLDPWVVLARVDVDDQGVIQGIDNCVCRRLMISFSSFWFQCQAAAIRIESAEPKEVQARAKGVEIIVHGANIDPNADVSVGRGINITKRVVDQSQTTLTLTVDVESSATAGPRTIRVTNPDGSTATTVMSIRRATGGEPAAPGGETPEPTKPKPEKPSPRRRKQ